MITTIFMIAAMTPQGKIAQQAAQQAAQCTRHGCVAASRIAMMGPMKSIVTINYSKDNSNRQSSVTAKSFLLGNIDYPADTDTAGLYTVLI